MLPSKATPIVKPTPIVKAKVTRSCAACRLSKVRCVQREESSLDTPCQRCHRLGLKCFFEFSKRGQANAKRDVARLGPAVRTLLANEKSSVAPDAPDNLPSPKIAGACNAGNSPGDKSDQVSQPSSLDDFLDGMLKRAVADDDLARSSCGSPDSGECHWISDPDDGSIPSRQSSPPRNQSSSSTQSYRSMLKPLMQIRSIGTATAASLTSSRRMAVEQLMEHCKDAIQMIETWKDEDENLRCAAAIEDELERSYSASEFSFQDSRTSLSTKSSGSDGTQASANVDSGTGATCHSPTLGAGNLRCAAAIEDELERSYSASEFSFQDSWTSLSSKSSGSDSTQPSANVDSGAGAMRHAPTLGAGAGLPGILPPPMTTNTTATSARLLPPPPCQNSTVAGMSTYAHQGAAVAHPMSMAIQMPMPMPYQVQSWMPHVPLTMMPNAWPITAAARFPDPPSSVPPSPPEAQPDEALKASADDDHGATGIRPADRLTALGQRAMASASFAAALLALWIGPKMGPTKASIVALLFCGLFVGIGIHILQHRTHEERTSLSVVFLFAITQPLMDYSMSAKELLSAINHAQQRHVAMVITALFALVGALTSSRRTGKGWLVVCACMMLAAAGAAVSAMKFGDHTILLYHYLWMFMTPYVSATLVAQLAVGTAYRL